MSVLHICSMCGQARATTTWGFPVCQDCADGLDATKADLEELERTDPKVRAAAEKMEHDIWRAQLRERIAARRPRTERNEPS